jgi:hypothetical protein
MGTPKSGPTRASRGNSRLTCSKIGPVPQLGAPKSRRKLEEFHTAVRDLIWRSEAPIGPCKPVLRRW